MSKIEVNQISSQCGSTLTIGQSGDTVTLAAGATQSGFGRTGTVDWNTTAITADPNPAVSGTGYFVNTTSGAITITLPTSPAAGDIVAFADYALTWDTNNLILDPGSNKINGDTTDYTVSSEGKSLTLVYTDSTQGWKVVNDGNSDAGTQAQFITATGGCVTCCGDYKIHTFTGPGTFTVTCAGNPAGSDTVDYLVVAGGGSGGVGGNASGGGGGAGGLRFSASTFTAPPTSAPRAGSALPVTAQGYSITVGGGGNASPGLGTRGGNGSNSIFSSITSTGGGGGGSYCTVYDGNPGGSGGGGAGDTSQGPCSTSTGGSGNTPPVSPSQGNPGGGGFDNSPNYPAGGGGGAGAAGTTQPNPGPAGPGGVGLQVNIDTNSYYYAGGGGGAVWENTNGGNGGLGGGGGGAAREPSQSAGTGGGCAVNPGGAGTNSWPTSNSLGGNGGANTGGGSGGNNQSPGATYSSGGSGIVIIRYRYQ